MQQLITTRAVGAAGRSQSPRSKWGHTQDRKRRIVGGLEVLVMVRSGTLARSSTPLYTPAGGRNANGRASGRCALWRRHGPVERRECTHTISDTEIQCDCECASSPRQPCMPQPFVFQLRKFTPRTRWLGRSRAPGHRRRPARKPQRQAPQRPS